MIGILFIIAISAFVLITLYGVILKCNSEMSKIEGDTEVFYVSRIGLAVTRIHFIVLAVPIIMATVFAVDNMISKRSQIILATNFRMIVVTTIVLCVLGALIQAITTFIINVQDSQDDDLHQ